METSSFKTSDNLSLIVHQYGQLEDSESIILLVHGHGEHGGRYEHVAKHFADNGFSTAVLTLRGHGESDGKRGHAPSMEQLLLDVEYFVRHVRKDSLEASLYLYGHSMGGNLVLNYLLNDQSNEIKAGIITSPWLTLAFEPPQWKIAVGNFIADIIPTFTQSSGLDANEISSIQEEVRKYENDPLNHDKISARLFKVIQKGGENILAKADKIHHPVFLAHGTADKVTDPKSSKKLAEANQLMNWKTYEANKHEIHHDKGAAELMKDVTNWLREK